ncbi:MAG: polysaccharide deacetylase family protein [Nitrospinae bacterium]|nr:polysaccharide deacetylase family protein [Nitrospinota bacterium]
MSAYILYYHRIYPASPAPDVTLDLFEWQMKYLKKRYTILSLDELLAYIDGKVKLDRPGVAITFDDGWFDNFVYAYPILKKYNIKATIFVSTGNIWDKRLVRKRIDEVADISILDRPLTVADGHLNALAGDRSQFLTWDELREMQESGLVSVQSHGVTHRKVFSDDKSSGILKEDSRWVYSSPLPGVALGEGIYPVKSGLVSRSFSPNVGSWESDEEMEKRIMGELAESRDRISTEIGVSPTHLCWPWGEYNELSIELAAKAGYSACYTTEAGTVTVDSDRMAIPRVSSSGGKMKFIKRGLVYSNSTLSRVYRLFSR